MKIVKYLATCILLLSISNLFAQGTYCPPPNIGFEEGSFQGWQCDTGGVNQSGIIQVIATSNPIGDRQTLIRGGIDTDEFGGFPRLCPYGGNYSVKLGNKETGARAERLSYTFTVPEGADVYALVYYYAVVFQNPKHLDYQQPRFTVKTFDVTDNDYVDCASFDFVASSGLTGFKYHVPKHGSDTAIYYKDWSPATINLRGYAGKQMRVEFTTNDCTLGGHFGYAYVDVNEDCGSPITGNNYCTGQPSLMLLAPGGFGAYTWYNASDLSAPLNSERGYTISPPPPDNTQYAVILHPYGGLGCTDTIYTTVKSINSGFTFKVQDTVFACPQSGADLTAAAITTGSSNGLIYSYYTDPLGTVYLFQPQQILKSGTYYIKAVSHEGCTNVLPIVVYITVPVIKVTNPAPVVYPNTVDIAATFTHEQGITYTYYTDTTASPITNYMTIGKSGKYYIRGANATGCTTTVPVRVVVNSPPPPIIQAVNTFTPNGDGINDYFNVTVIGFGAFESLRIYNRYGQLVFETKSADATWDGKFNGKPVNTGTYYWVFTGKNTYYNTGVVQGGYVDLIR